ncbi:hypothetical protein C1H46_004681 [Malus baccata]|uniref:MADS-box domain-containing protein n=1 Tax=Malus baccata TaxID=106549 RepID=A0A540NF98_MALBA|nr:hypothetical protein C1H46_004681 [Malus baccata]
MAKGPDNKITDKDIANGKKERECRRRVEIKRVEDKNKRHVTFSKRKRGIFNKAAELSVLTGAETAAIVVSSNGKVFCFGSPSPNAVIDLYLGDNTSLLPEGQPDNHLQNNNIHHSSSKNQIEDYAEASRRLKEAKILKGGKNSNNNGGEGGETGCSYGWWERWIGMMSSLEELEEYRDALYKLKHNVEVRTNQMIRETSPSNHFSPLLFMDDIWSSPELSQGQGWHRNLISSYDIDVKKYDWNGVTYLL